MFEGAVETLRGCRVQRASGCIFEYILKPKGAPINPGFEVHLEAKRPQECNILSVHQDEPFYQLSVGVPIIGIATL